MFKFIAVSTIGGAVVFKVTPTYWGYTKVLPILALIFHFSGGVIFDNLINWETQSLYS